jgi:hypothetical protein
MIVTSLSSDESVQEVYEQLFRGQEVSRLHVIVTCGYSQETDH